MAKMGFNDKLIHWMSMCVECVDNSVFVNNGSNLDFLTSLQAHLLLWS